MKKIISIVAIFVGFILLTIAWLSVDTTSTVPVDQSPATSVEVAPIFSWRFAEADTSNLDGIPKTNVFLTASNNNTEQVRLIDTVDGGCSELEGEKYEGDISNTGKVQCYYAGLGQQYQITAQEKNIYRVERKLFEEALPDNSSLEYTWEVVEEFLFF